MHFRLSENSIIHKTPVSLEIAKDACTLFDPTTGREFGILDKNGAKILDVLGKDISLQLFADRISTPSTNTPEKSTISARKGKRPKREKTLELFAVLYGSYSFFEAVGHFAAECKLFLQHPMHCNRNVPYKNPHCLSPRDSKIVHTHDLVDHLSTKYEPEVEEFTNPIDLFADAQEQIALAYTEPPQALRTKLYDHQKQALTFMLQRESGWAMNGHHKDIWKEEIDAQGRVTYLNTITGQRQTRFPLQFRGGLLIDAPGLGKSLNIIALLLLDSKGQQHGENDEASLSTTLLIVPKTCKLRDFVSESIIGTNFASDPDLERRVAKVSLLPFAHVFVLSVADFGRHLKSPKDLNYCVFYGKDRTKHLSHLEKYNLVITTYSVVRLDWKMALAQPENPLTLHKVQWGRVVLDEGG